MNFSEGGLYHIYNRGNNKQKIFFLPDNYIFFLKKVRRYILPHCDILAYCLMPNHFHLFIYASDKTVKTIKMGQTERNVMSEGIRNLLQTYSKAINKQNESTGSLFQQNTKARNISQGSANYDWTCMTYIHQNPVKAKLVKKMEDWMYSSFQDYCGIRSGTLCNKELAIKLIDIDIKRFYEHSYKFLNTSKIKKIF